MTRFPFKDFPLGKVLISVTAAGTTVGPYLFDWNKTHIYHPKWPPHAKFHNAQTMSMGPALSLAALYHLWRPGYSRAALDSAAMSASTYWVTQLSAKFYPGTASVDPPGEDNWPQLKYALPMLGAIAVGYLTERYRLTRR
jgi:hypothetical protein